jgi:hypothetical protein
MANPRQLISIWAVSVAAWNPVSRATDEQSTTVQPRPGSLSAAARTRSLVRPPGTDTATPIVITNDTLDELADGAIVTILTRTAAPDPVLRPDGPVDPKTRETWRRKVLAQSKVIARVEGRRARVVDEISRLERGRLDSRTLDRIEKAEAKLRLIDTELAREKTELSRVVRAARKDGAQPGWFR